MNTAQLTADEAVPAERPLAQNVCREPIVVVAHRKCRGSLHRLGKTRGHSQETNDELYVKSNMPIAHQLGQERRRVEYVPRGRRGWSGKRCHAKTGTIRQSVAQQCIVLCIGTEHGSLQRVIFGDTCWPSRHDDACCPRRPSFPFCISF